MLLKPFLRRVRRGVHIRRKNARIDRNIRTYIGQVSGRPSPRRETHFAVEVLIPCYNHGRYLEGALRSIPVGCAITVIDDASTDDTPAIIRELGSAFRFKSIRNENNLLQSGSLNRGVAESDNNLFIVLNADDCLLPFTVDTVVREFETSPTIRMVGGGAIQFARDESRRLLEMLPKRLDYVPNLQIFNREAALGYRRLNDINMSMSGSAFLRSAWEGAGGFLDFKDRVCSYDDRDFQMRVSCLFDVGIMEEPLCFYRVSSSLGRAEYTG